MTVARCILLLAALAGLSGVVLAAVGSHLVPALSGFDHYKSWQSATNMHLLHSVVLLFLASLYDRSGDGLIVYAAIAIVLGIILFSGSIYLSLILAASTRLAPVGGLLLMLGWLLIGVYAIRRPGL
jgi:uncharacterized membrane protein YgdD (TMEM256/DUF423 family)